MQETITIYSKPKCQACRMTKNKLSSMNIKYTEIDVEENKDALNDLKQLNITTLPVVKRGTTIISIGFQPEKIRAL